jgi:hypothetical protein
LEAVNLLPVNQLLHKNCKFLNSNYSGFSVFGV